MNELVSAGGKQQTSVEPRGDVVSYEDFRKALQAISGERARIPELRRQMGERVPRALFDEYVLRLQREGIVRLAIHAWQPSLREKDARDCIPSDAGPLYFLRWL